MNRLKKSEAAYIAGFLDADGSIYVQLKPNKTYRFGFQVAPQIVFFQSQKELTHLGTMREMIGGGHLRIRKDGVVEYIIGDIETMRALLKAVKPYLILKKPQADLMIKILDHKAKVKGREEFLLLAGLVDKFKNLNYSKNRKNTLLEVVNRLKSQ
jgi:intein-encoded DNA endonuclease-like protein